MSADRSSSVVSTILPAFLMGGLGFFLGLLAVFRATADLEGGPVAALALSGLGSGTGAGMGLGGRDAFRLGIIGAIVGAVVGVLLLLLDGGLDLAMAASAVIAVGLITYAVRSEGVRAR